uniref:Uncharacterized protein n=1 Tax=Anopheles merus TaxID=30066 RepID=A0A182USD6_ANOME
MCASGHARLYARQQEQQQQEQLGQKYGVSLSDSIRYRGGGVNYARPDGGSERSRSNGSISSVATTQSSSSCVSVHSSAASLADAANANLLAVVSAPKGVESDSSPVPKCVDSAGSCGGGGAIGTTTTTTTTTSSSGSNCCVRAAAAGESGSVGGSQQVPSSRTRWHNVFRHESVSTVATGQVCIVCRSWFWAAGWRKLSARRYQLQPGQFVRIWH